MLLTQADIQVHQGIRAPSTSRAQMAHGKVGSTRNTLWTEYVHGRVAVGLCNVVTFHLDQVIMIFKSTTAGGLQNKTWKDRESKAEVSEMCCLERLIEAPEKDPRDDRLSPKESAPLSDQRRFFLTSELLYVLKKILDCTEIKVWQTGRDCWVCEAANEARSAECSGAWCADGLHMSNLIQRQRARRKVRRLRG